MSPRFGDLDFSQSDADFEQQLQEAERFKSDIEGMLDTGRFHWCETLLEGIHETVSKTKRVTEGQREAVRNIQTAGERREWRKSRS